MNTSRGRLTNAACRASFSTNSFLEMHLCFLLCIWYRWCNRQCQIVFPVPSARTVSKFLGAQLQYAECSPCMSIGQQQWMHQLLKSTVHDSILVQLIGADPLTDTSFVELETMVTNWHQGTEQLALKVTTDFVNSSHRSIISRGRVLHIPALA